jgi:beta-lactamase regulating signal transducer with metallopeptidase domain
MISDSLLPIANHLWQSTLFAGVAGLLTLALRKNPARVRNWVWLVASCKFLIPFSVLMSLGGYIGWRTEIPVATQASFSIALDQVSQPFPVHVIPARVSATMPPIQNPLPAILFGIWACGLAGIACSWWVRWRRIRAAVRAGSPVKLDLPIMAISSPTLLEPGVFGVFRPTLLLPEGITKHLTPAQLKAVIAHELCHVRHRDNLTAAIQMFVESVFWFHPLAWWIGKRMVDEREQACDEEVLRLGNEPRVYAQGMLTVCEFYLESRLACVAGVSGSNLRRRIEGIMNNRIVDNLNGVKKLLLAGAGMLAVAVPIVVASGVLSVDRLFPFRSPGRDRLCGA